MKRSAGISILALVATNAFAAGSIDADLNRDGGIDAAELDLMRAVFFTADVRADLNGDGRVDFADLALLKAASQGLQPNAIEGGGAPPVVFLQPDSQGVPIGDQVSVDLFWDFTGDAAIGGGTDIMWDPSAFALVSIVFDDNFGNGAGQFDPAFTRCDDEPCSSPGLIDGLATGNFNGLGDPGPIYIATLTFATLAEGSFDIELAEDTGIAGPFVSAIRFDIYPDLQFIGAAVEVTPGGPAPRILVVPPTLDFPDTVVGSTAFDEIILRSSGTLPLEIESVTQPPAPFAISDDDCTGRTLQPAEECILTVAFTPTALGLVDGEFTVTSNAQNQPAADVLLTGIGIALPAPDIVAPPLVPFDTIRVGQSAEQTVVVRNGGSALLDIGEIGASNALEPPFAMSFDGCSQRSLSPDQACAVQLTFNPTIAGPATDDFDIPSNDPDSPSTIVEVRGIAHPEVMLAAAGLQGTGARCENRDTGQVVAAGLDGRTSVPCQTGGLFVGSNDEVQIGLRGVAVEGDLTGQAFGMSVDRARCQNETTGHIVNIDPPGQGNAWNCTAAGLTVTPGDTVSMSVRGNAI